jgi:cytochrome c
VNSGLGSLLRQELQMRNCLALLTLALGLGMLCLAAVAEDDSKAISYGRHLASECTACHRVDGVDNGIPAIVGWDAERLIATLEFYRAGARTNPVMVSVAKSLDLEQIRALAAYYAAQPKK